MQSKIFKLFPGTVQNCAYPDVVTCYVKECLICQDIYLIFNIAEQMVVGDIPSITCVTRHRVPTRHALQKNYGT